jgi:hypothetical protein
VAAPLIVATDVRNMSEEKRSILLNKEVIAVNQGTAGMIWFCIRRHVKAICVMSHHTCSYLSQCCPFLAAQGMQIYECLGVGRALF